MFCILFTFFDCQQVLIKLRVSSLLLLINDASVDIADDEVFVQFSHKG